MAPSAASRLSLQVLAQAAGPLLSGMLRDWSGDYTDSLAPVRRAGGFGGHGGACRPGGTRSHLKRRPSCGSS